MFNLTPELAEIFGLLCSEGSHIISYSSYWGKDRGRKRFFKNDKSERIEFSNKDRNLLNHYKTLLNVEFNYFPRITKHNKVNICKMSIIQYLRSFTKFGHLKWRVPKFILEGNNNVKISFLRGFFDGDGCANKVRIISTNLIGLKQISKLITQLKIKHTIQGPHNKENRKPCYCIQISTAQREIFLNLIKPVSKRSGTLRG